VTHTHTYTPIHFNREYLERVEHIFPSHNFWFAPLVCKENRNSEGGKIIHVTYTHTYIPIHFNREYLERVEHIFPSHNFWFAPFV